MSSCPATVADAHVAATTGRRIIVGGMPGAAAGWLARAAVLLLQGESTPARPLWSGWADNLPGGCFGEDDCVVRSNDCLPALMGAADHVLFARRDLRDAVVACQRGLGVATSPRMVQTITEQATRWELAATLIASHETILGDPVAVLRRLAEHLGLTVSSPDWMLDQLQQNPAAATLSAGRGYTPPRAYLTALNLAVLERIEVQFGIWLLERGYDCATCSSRWVGVTAEPDMRERLWAEFQGVADECAPRTADGISGEVSAAGLRKQVERLETFFRGFGAPCFQSSAAELLSVLGGPNQVVECAAASLLLRQRKFAAALVQAQKALAWGDNEFVRELHFRCAANPAVGQSLPRVDEGGPPAVVSGKTARAPLPEVSPTARHDQESIRRLARHVQGRTVGFILHGSSVAALSAQVMDQAASDVVWVGLNHFSLLEERFLLPTRKNFSVVFCCADGEVERRLPALESFLGRSAPKLLVTRPDHLAACEGRLGKFRESIALESLPPLWPYPNSLTIFLRMLVQSGPRRIVLFGCDGYLGDDDISLPSYIGAEEFIREKRYSGVLLDTLLFNAHMPRVLNRWGERLGPDFPEIVNCSPGTMIQGIPTIDYGLAGAALAGAPITTGSPGVPVGTPVPRPLAPDDPIPDLIGCLNAGRRGDLARARAHALRAARLAPGRLTPFAQRVLQTDPRAVAAAYHLLMLTGATQPGAARIRAADFAREMRDMSAAVGDAPLRWETWE